MPRGVPPAAIVASLLAVIVFAGSHGGSATAGNGNGNGNNAVPAEIQADFDADGVVEVIVALENEDVLNALRARTGNGGANGQAQREAAQEFKGRRENVAAGLPSDAQSVEPYDQLGAFSLTVTDQRTLDFLARHPLVKGLEPVRVLELEAVESLPFINQPAVESFGLTGTGTSVAVLDTGVNYTHSDFGSCSAPGVPTSCRVAVSMEFDTDPFDNDQDVTDGHGTNVSGIVAAVAPETTLLVLDVFNASGTTTSTQILDALDWVMTNAATHNTKAVNMSLGGTVYNNQSQCDSLSSGTLNAFAALRANGIFPVVASGNNADKNGVSWPGCVSGAHAVGAVYDADYGPRNWQACTSTTTPDDATTAPDKVTCFSNSHPTLLDSLAPGTFVIAGGSDCNPNGDGLGCSGTSMAAPHVAGAAAVMADTGCYVGQIEWALTSTGPQVTDLNGVTKSRLDLLAATGLSAPVSPQFDSAAPTSVVVGSEYTYAPLATGLPCPTLSLVTGPEGMSLTSLGLLSWTPDDDDVGPHDVTIEATNTTGTVQQTWTISVTSTQLFFSVQAGQTLSGVSMADEDIVFFDGATFSRYFDGSTQGIGSFVIDAFDVINSNEILFSFTATGSVDGVSFDDSDVLKFTASTGAFTMYFDASDVGLASSTFGPEEDVDAVQLRNDGHLIVSTNSNFSVAGLSGVAQDLIRFIPTSTGGNTTGSWAMYWDGSDGNVLTQSGENVDGASLADGDLYLSTSGAFAVPGASGENEDVFVCRDPNPGDNTSCGLWEMFFDGSAAGIAADRNLTAIDIPDAPTPPNITSTAPQTATVDVVYSYQAAATGSTPITWSLDTAPSGMDIDANTGLVTWTPTLADVALSPHAVTIEATNGAGSDSQDWQITVSLPDAPVITSTPGTVATVEQPYSYQATATGAGPITWALGTFPTGMTVDANTGLVSWTPDAGDIGDHPVTLEATNIGGTTPQNWTVTVSEEPIAPPAQLYFAVANDGTVGTPPLSVANEDIVAFDGTSFSIFFDGSAAGLSTFAIDAFDIINSDEILLSFTAAGSVPGLAGTTDDSDVVKYTISTGTFSMYFDGSDVGLTTNAEDVDAIHFISNQRLALSTNGAVSTSSGFSAVGQDLIRFTFADGSSGANTAGAWRMWWDGSDVGLTDSGENIKGASLSGGRLHLTTSGNFTVTGVSGANEDVFVCETPTTGPTSVCGLWNTALFFDGSTYGLGANNIVAIGVP